MSPSWCMEQLNKQLIKELSDQKYALDHAAIVAITDTKGKILSVNEKFCEISGYSQDELIGQDHRIINSGTHDKSFFKNLWATISSGIIWKGEICNRRKDGALYWVFTTIVPFLSNENSKPYQFVAIRQDITELKQLQKTIIDQHTQMVSASRLSAIGEMAAAITHEINNPLGVILGRCEMLKKNAFEDIMNKDLIFKNIDAIEKTGQRIEKIVKSMKLLAYHGESEDFSRVKVNEILSDTLDLCAERFKNKGILLKTPAVEGYFLNCISYQIVQVLVNLLNNAFDAVENLNEKWVKIELHDKSDSLEISVTDSGPGISENIAKNLFQPFFSTKKIRYGTGLGLSVSKSILIKHGGDLVLDSSCPNTKFNLIFPKK